MARFSYTFLVYLSESQKKLLFGSVYHELRSIKYFCSRAVGLNATRD